MSSVILKFIKRGNKLVLKTSLMKHSFNKFVESIPEGSEIEVFMDLMGKDNTKAQLRKIHVCLKEIANENGQTLEEAKEVLKDECGFYTFINNEKKYKSLADLTKDQLSYAIMVLYRQGDMLNINFDQNLH